jgi:hypothetical protein
MKFQWYVINLDDGEVVGTNDVDDIREHLKDDNFVVLTAQHGKYFCGSTDEKDVQPLPTKDEGEGDGEDADEEGDGDDDAEDFGEKESRGKVGDDW